MTIILNGTTGITTPALDSVAPFSSADMPAGSVLQVKQITSASIVSTTNSSFTDTGISWTFDNSLLAGSKVLVSLDVVMSQQYSGSWASLAYVTIYEGAINRGDTLNGIAGSAANLGGATSSTAMQYDVERIGGSCVFTPSSTTPTIQLYFRTSDPNTGIKLNTSWANSFSTYRSTLTGFIMEIA